MIFASSADLFLAVLIPSSLLVVLPLVYMFWNRHSAPAVKGRHCYITGGSKGTGKALAIQLAKLGANITIVARNQKDLILAVEEIKAACASNDQKVISVSSDVSNQESAKEAVEQAAKLMGKVPELVFNCAGISLPGMFLDQDLKEHRYVMDVNYFGALYTSQPAAQLMVKEGVKDGRIVFVASTLALLGIVGYAQYCPAKYALRGLAEVLQQELLPYDIRVHIMFPSTILSPGFEEEQKRKPAITKKIEEADTPQTPEQVVKSLLKGIARNHRFITGDFITDMARCVGRGTVPTNGPLDHILSLIGNIAFPFWRMYLDRLIAKELKK